MATAASLLLSCFAMYNAGLCVHHGDFDLVGYGWSFKYHYHALAAINQVAID